MSRENMKMLQTWISNDLHRHVKLVSALTGLSIQDIVAEAIEEHLELFSLPQALEETTETLEKVTA